MSSFEEGTGTGGKILSFIFCSSSSTYLFQHERQKIWNVSKHFSLILDSGFHLESNIRVILI